jgi:intracellular septation protein A
VSVDQAPILLATAVAILATFGQVGWVLARGRKVDSMLWISLAIIVVMGGETLLLRDPTFIKWKPTVMYWYFDVFLLGGIFCCDGRSQSVRRIQLFRERLGQLQAVRGHRFDGCVRRPAGVDAVALYRE